MNAHVSAATWEHVIQQALDGDPRHLLELLLRPTQTDSDDRPLPGAFVALPDDAALRLRIVRALMLGHWGGAQSIEELMTKTGWGKGKPSISDYEVVMAEVALRSGAGLNDMAEGLDIDSDTLARRIKKRAKRKPLT